MVTRRQAHRNFELLRESYGFTWVLRGLRGEAKGALAGWWLPENCSLRGGGVLVLVHGMLSALSTESQIVVTCEGCNKEFWRVFQGTSRFKV